MKTVFYLLIFVILAYCLISTYKISEKFIIIPPPAKPVISKILYYGDQLKVEWNQPPYEDLTITEPITGYIILIKKVDNKDEGIFMKIADVTGCATCTYTLSNLNLEDNQKYYCAVLAINKTGVSQPSDPKPFTAVPLQKPTPTPTETYSPTPTPTYNPLTINADSLLPTVPPNQQGIYQMTLEDRIKAGEDARKVYLDNELNNMIVRANGIYEVDSDKLSYPDTYLADVRESINTVNNMVKKDLQEYRMNIHIAADK
jgi:hypothetical protein